MKFKDVFIERNFRISNDDQYAKERIAATILLDDGEDEQKAMNLAREKIVQNFKAAYPKVYTYLNFDEVRQVDDVVFSDGSKVKDYAQVTTKSVAVFENGEPKFYDNIHDLKASTGIEKISKGTIEEQIHKAWDGTDGATYHKPPTLEEQIEASKDLNELNGWKLIAKTNRKLQKIFDKKEKELTV